MGKNYDLEAIGSVRALAFESGAALAFVVAIGIDVEELAAARRLRGLHNRIRGSQEASSCTGRWIG
jgi:4'-phosphopantetheinyl transferase EntD